MKTYEEGKRGCMHQLLFVLLLYVIWSYFEIATIIEIYPIIPLHNPFTVFWWMCNIGILVLLISIIYNKIDDYFIKKFGNTITYDYWGQEE